MSDLDKIDLLDIERILTKLKDANNLLYNLLTPSQKRNLDTSSINDAYGWGNALLHRLREKLRLYEKE